MPRHPKPTTRKDCCGACGGKWVHHHGLSDTCSALQYARLAGMEIAAENKRLKERLSGAMAFRLIVYLSVLKDGEAFTAKNLLRALEKLRRAKRPQTTKR